VKRPEGKNVKDYCYKNKNDCRIVKTGFGLLEFYACSVCKQEVTQYLRDRQDEETSTNLDLFDFWNTFNGDGS
jgi:hypothetical protein